MEDYPEMQSVCYSSTQERSNRRQQAHNMQTPTFSSTQKMNFRVVVLLEEKNRTKWEVGEVQHVWKSMLCQMMEYHNMNTSNNSSPQTLHVPREQ